MLKENIQFVDGKEGADIFNQLREIVVGNEMFDGLTATDEAFLLDSLGVLLVTEPINQDEPFTVNFGEKVPNQVRGQNFKVRHVKVKPFQLGYVVEFVAVNPVAKCDYSFEGRVCYSFPHVVVEKAEVRHREVNRFSDF